MTAVRLGLVGCGSMGRRHATAFSALRKVFPDAVFAAVLDSDPARAESVACDVAAQGQKPPHVAGSMRELLALVDAVDIVLPTALHRGFVTDALHAGRHVVVEKPIALTVSDALAMARLAREAGAVLAVAENFRRIPANRALRSLLASGGLTAVKYMRTHVLHSRSAELATNATTWYEDPGISGSYVAFELGAHEADMTRYLLGEVDSVSALVYQQPGEVREPARADTVLATFRCSSGAVAQLAISLTSRFHGTAARDIVTADATITSSRWEAWADGAFSPPTGPAVTSAEAVDRYLRSAAAAGETRDLPGGTFGAGPPYVDRDDPLRYGTVTALHDFVRAIDEGSSPEIDGFDAARTLAICEAMVASSARSGAPVCPGDLLAAAAPGGQQAIRSRP